MAAYVEAGRTRLRQGASSNKSLSATQERFCDLGANHSNRAGKGDRPKSPGVAKCRLILIFFSKINAV
jgi:hypothetical protein